MQILAPKTGAPAYQKAALAFQQMYQAVTGICLPVVDTPSDTEDLVVIGTDGVQPFGFDKLSGGFPVTIGSDEYCIISQTEGDRTVLYLAGGRGRSTLYAVYDFFARQAGCSYYWDGDVIPHRDTIEIQNLNIVEKPRFQYRAIRYFAHRGLTRFQAEHWDFDQWKQEIDYIVKARLNTFMLRIGMDDLFQKAFPESVAYPPDNAPMPGAGTGYNNRTTAWPLAYRGQLRKKVLQYAFDCDLMHPEDFGTMTHWYSRTPIDFLENVKPKLMTQRSASYSEQTGQVWDIFDDRNIENYQKLTDTHVTEYGKGEIFHTIGLAERTYDDDRRKNLELKKFAYKRFLDHIYDRYPNAKVLIAAWDFYFRLQPEEVQEIIGMFDPEKTLILDYTADLKYDKSNLEKWDVQGKFPWIFGLFHGYMPQSHVHGDYDYIAKKIAAADADPCCKGMDFWPELSHSDTLMQAYFAENAWRPTGRDIAAVAKDLCQGRYAQAKAEMWSVWEAFLPLINLPDIDYTACFFNLLQNGVLKALTDPAHPDYDQQLARWEQVVAEQKGYEDKIIALLQTVANLPSTLLADRFVYRDCVDLVRSALTQKLHIDYIDAAIALTRWQRGALSADEVAKKWTDCSKILVAFADILDTHPDYSMYQTLLEQEKNRPINPYFADALKDNLLNYYCRTAAFELVKFVYCKEAAVLENWVKETLDSGKIALRPEEIFTAEQARIFDEFKALPFAQMHEAPPCDLKTAIVRVLEMMK